VIAATSLVAQAGAAATGFFGKAITALGGPISATILAATAINARSTPTKSTCSRRPSRRTSPAGGDGSRAGDGPCAGGGAEERGDELSESARKFAALSEQRSTELGKLGALNGAYRESATSLQILGLQYDGQIQKSADAKEHHGRELTALNSLTDGITRRKIAQVLLNEQLQRAVQLQSARDSRADTLRSAQQGVILAGQDPATAERTRNQFEEFNRRQDAERTLKEQEEQNEKDIVGARQRGDATLLRAIEQRRAAQKVEYDEAVAGAHRVGEANDAAITKAREAATKLSVGLTVSDTEAQTRGIRAMMAAELQGGKAVERMRVQLAGNEAVQRAVNDATARGTEITNEQADSLRQSAEAAARASIEAEKLRAVYQEVSGAVNQFFTDVFNRKNPVPALAQQIKAEIIAAVSQPITAKITASIVKVLGIDVPASKQEKAAKDMNTAADKQLRAAQIMAGQTPDVGGGPGSTTEDPRAAAIRRYGAQIAGVAGAGLGGYGAGYGIGQATGSGTLGAIGGAITGAKLGAAFGPPGMVVGALAGFAGGILGAGDAAKEAAAKLAAAQKAFQNAFDAFKAEIAHDPLSAQIANVRAQADAIRQASADAVTFNDLIHGKWHQTMQEITDAENERIQQLEEEAAALRHYFDEDLDVRILRAQGKDKEADALEIRNRQERERDEYQRTHKMVDDPKTHEDDAEVAENIANYNKLLYAQSLELQANTKALNELNTSLHNAPSGFKIEGYIQQYAKAAPYPGQWQVPTNPFVPPMSPLNPPMLSQSNTGKVATVTFAPGSIVVQESKTPQLTAEAIGKVAAKAFLAEVDKTVAATGGPNTTRAVALNTMSVS
jgi:gas vesicle protein